jgi:TRAP-type C4-dicarboxylate transport system substrate-binding protein
MNQQNVWALTLSSDTFNALKSDFDQVLRKTLTNMENKESEQAELTVKLKISLMKEQAPNFDSLIPGAQREVIKPKFDHKVSSVMQIKDEKTGTLSGNYELVWDGELGQYVMREIKDP